MNQNFIHNLVIWFNYNYKALDNLFDLSLNFIEKIHSRKKKRILLTFLLIEKRPKKR